MEYMIFNHTKYNLTNAEPAGEGSTRGRKYCISNYLRLKDDLEFKYFHNRRDKSIALKPTGKKDYHYSQCLKINSRFSACLKILLFCKFHLPEKKKQFSNS